MKRKVTHQDALKHTFEDWENLDVTVVVYRSFAISFQVEWVNHIDIIKVGSGSFIGQVNWVMKRQIQTGNVSNLA